MGPDLFPVRVDGQLLIASLLLTRTGPNKTSDCVRLVDVQWIRNVCEFMEPQCSLGGRRISVLLSTSQHEGRGGRCFGPPKRFRFEFLSRTCVYAPNDVESGI
jgi:hypothetical protein